MARLAYGQVMRCADIHDRPAELTIMYVAWDFERQRWLYSAMLSGPWYFHNQEKKTLHRLDR